MKTFAALFLAVGLFLSSLFITNTVHAFDWRAHEGESIKLMLVAHTWTDATIKRLEKFTELTGIQVTYDVLPEEEYFDKLTLILAGRSDEYDVFMTGAQQIWEFASSNWIKPLDGYIADGKLTNPDFDLDDFLPSMIAAGRWNLKSGSAVGSGSTWALPWVSHGSALFYRKDILDKHKIAPPKNLQQLHDVVVKLKKAEPDMYPLSVRGTRSWATIHPSVLSWFASYGGKDFNADMECTIDEPKEIVDAHKLWGKILKDGGPPNYASMTWYEVFSDMVGGKAVMAYDADVLGFFVHQPANEAVWGKIAWTEPPGKPDGQNASALWIWLMAMNANSVKKDSAWYFLQWVAGKDHLTDAALNDVLINPVRKSVWANPEFEKRFADHTGYYRVFNATTENSGLYYTPQKNFFEFTAEWAAAIQKIVAGYGDPEKNLNQVTKKIDRLKK